MICENSKRSIKLFNDISALYWVEKIGLDEFREKTESTDCVILVDCNISSKESIMKLKEIIKETKSGHKILFLIDGYNVLQTVQSEALGGSRVASKAIPTGRLVKVIGEMMREIHGPEGGDAPSDMKHVLDYTTLINQEVVSISLAGKRLPKKAIEAVADQIIKTIKKHGLESWLEAVTHYHRHTHRHCMMVTGLAIAFGQHLQLAEEDIRLLAVAGLLHDIGKSRIPIRVLEKTGELTDEESDLVQRHPAFSYDILKRDGQFSPIIANAAAQHHEYLDGSGYPQGLSGRQINPLVRMLTIVDIYANLTEARTGKEADSAHLAYQKLGEMDRQLDKKMLTHFRPVVLSDNFVPVRRPKLTDRDHMPPTLSVNRSPLDRAAINAA